MEHAKEHNQLQNKRTKDQSDIDRRERAKRLKVSKTVEVCIQCPKCEVLLALDMPDGGGRQCNCVKCNERIFVHKHIDECTVDESEALDPQYDTPSYCLSTPAHDQRYTNTESGNILVEAAITNERVHRKHKYERPCVSVSKRGKLSFEYTKPQVCITAMPMDILECNVFRRLDMCTLSRLDQTCVMMHEMAERVTESHASLLHLRLRAHERWSDLRLSVHCLWIQNGRSAGMQPFLGLQKNGEKRKPENY